MSGLGGGSSSADEKELEQHENTEEVALQLSVPGVSRLEDVAFSKSVRMKGHQWRIMVVHREVNSKDVMGAYIQHVGGKSTPSQPNWSIVINASISLVNQLDPGNSYTKEFRHQYTRNSTDWGYSNFLRWKEVMNPHRGFVKDDTILLQARLVYPGPDAHPDPTPSLSQSHSTLAPSSQPHPSHNHTSSSSLSRTTTSISSSAISRVPPTPTSLISSLSQLSSQDSVSETSQLTPSSTSVLPPEMASFLSCSHCNEQYEAEGRRSPHTLRCGHSFCLACLEKMVVKEEGGRQKLTCPTCSREVSGGGNFKPWFPNHSVAQLVTSVLSKAKHFCPIHQHDRNYYCLRDQILVCIYCAYHGEHAGHPCQPACEARQTVRGELRPLRMRVQGRVSEAERRLQLMREEGEAVRTQATASAKMVEDFFAGLEAALRRQRDLLLKDLHTHTSSLHSSMDTQMKELERHHSKARRSLEEYDKWKGMSAREALSSVSSITQTLQTAASASLPLPTPQTATTVAGLRVHVELPSSHLLLSSLGPLGHVTVTSPSASSRVGPATDKPPEQVGWVMESVNGGSRSGETEPRNQQSQEEEGEDTQEPLGDSVMDTQEEGEGERGGGGGEGEGEGGGSGGVTKRTLMNNSSPDFELRNKKRKI